MVTTATQRRIVTQTAEDHRRRAAQAEREGVRILCDARSGRHVATSASNASRCYAVSTHGCTCKGFTFWSRCKHYSLLLSELGRIPDPEPAMGDAEQPHTPPRPASLHDLRTGRVVAATAHDRDRLAWSAWS